MYYKIAGIIFTFILFTSCVGSSKNTLPQALNGNGILVVPLTAVSEKTMGGSDFGYGYILSYKPNTNVKLQIKPSLSKNALIFGDLPPGKYTIDGMTTVGMTGGDLVASSPDSFRTITPIFFEIKPNTITILDRMFDIKVEERSAFQATQRHRLSYLTEQKKEIVLEDLKKIENFGLWEINY